MYYMYCSQGFYIGDSLEEVPNSTDIRPPQPCWKPRFVGGQWYETATESETVDSALIQERISVLQQEIDTLQAKLTKGE